MNDEENTANDAEDPSDVAVGSGEAQLPSMVQADQKRSHKRKGPTTFRKAPQAPKRFKSSYIFFSMAKMEELRKEGGDETKVTNTSSRIAEMWRNLSDEERKKWDEIAKQDKLRYMAEKTLYTGPWQVPSKRIKKDPTAPKRPMSAFLFFSQGTRQKIKEEKPHLKNTEISSILGEMWKNLSDEERKPHIEREVREREQYKKEMAVWREKRAGEEEAEKKRKDAIVSEFIKSGFVPGSNPPSMPMPIEGGPAMLPQMPTPMAPGMMPFPPMMMPPGMAPMPMAMPPNIEGAEQVTEGGQDQQQQVGQSIYHGSQPQNQPPYQGYYYPMYPYPYPHMVMPPPGMYPVIPQPQQDVEGGGGPAVPYTEAGNGSG